MNLLIIGVSIEKAVEQGKKGPVTFGFYMRILLFGGAFVLAVKTSGISGVGAFIGFLLPQVVLFIKLGMLPAILAKLRKEPPPVYKTDTSSNLFIKEPCKALDFRGRTYVTYRHYRKIRVVPEPATPADAARAEKKKVKRNYKNMKRLICKNIT